MDILTKIIVAVFSAAALISLVIVGDKWVARVTDYRLSLVARAFLYAAVFTPTAYHHAPNTIVAPLHLSTICGNLFYSYDYTPGMFLYGVAMPVFCGWMFLSVVFLLRKLPEPS